MTQENTTEDLAFTPDPNQPLAMLKACPAYQASPLRTLTLEDGSTILAKDETDRMGLGAFKALGGPYTMIRLIQQLWHKQNNQHLDAERILDDDVKAFTKKITFVCTSAGNHGVGVAAGARFLGAKARVYLAKTVPENFAKILSNIGAEVVIEGENYEQSLAVAIEDANRTGAILLQDGTWPGYIELPKIIMEGYTVIAEELRQEFEQTGHWPSDVYLQAGVGGLAAAIAHMIRENWAVQPNIIIVEPDAAPCLKASAEAGKPVQVQGPDSNMGRLDCKEPSIVAFHTLENCNVRYVTVSDEEGARAAERVTALGIATSPSGSAGFAAILKEDKFPDNPLVIISEGAM